VHELSLCEAIAASVDRHAAGRAVAEVTVRVGHLRQVVPDALTFSWEVLTAGTSLAGSALVVEQVPAVVRCGPCGSETTLDMPVLLCGSCESGEVTLLSGEELQVVALDLAEA
jgi:hydrogenase nickel incorporation protein HypA/HybF